MKRVMMLVALGGIGGLLCAGIAIDPRVYKRGDANNDNVVSMADVQFLATYVYQSGPEPPCMNQADANDDSFIDGADLSYLVNWLMSGGPEPPAPGPFSTVCTDDPTAPYLGCDQPLCD
ncbi:MAG: dockerin type I domain-containing protein [Planctomycetota bacterium]|nr:dockerin type I domain-containing protein [Planctomycetota bacterium]